MSVVEVCNTIVIDRCVVCALPFPDRKYVYKSLSSQAKQQNRYAGIADIIFLSDIFRAERFVRFIFPCEYLSSEVQVCIVVFAFIPQIRWICAKYFLLRWASHVYTSLLWLLLMISSSFKISSRASLTTIFIIASPLLGSLSSGLPHIPLRV